MKLSVSTWNYLGTYGWATDLKQAIEEIAIDGFGLELWLDWSVIKFIDEYEKAD